MRRNELRPLLGVRGIGEPEQLSGLIAVRFNLMFYLCAETVECAFFASQLGIVIVISV